jgi:hypothetical protein
LPAIWGKATVVKGSDVQKLLEQLANASGPAIRSLVEKAAKERKVPKEDAEELIQLLTNLSKNARFHTTNGTKLSAVVQTEKLIEKLLMNFGKGKTGTAYFLTIFPKKYAVPYAVPFFLSLF